MFDPQNATRVGDSGIFPVLFDPVISPAEEKIAQAHFFKIHPNEREQIVRDQIQVMNPDKNPAGMVKAKTGQIDVYPAAAQAAGIISSIQSMPISVTTYTISLDSGAAPPGTTLSDPESSVSLSAQSTPFTSKSPSNSNELDTLNDPVQGASLDCYFIAALSANTWSRFTLPFPTGFGQSALPSGIYFFWVDTVNKCYYQYYTINPKTGGDHDGKILFAKLTTDKSESWCNLYEQAYAKMKGVPTDQYGNYMINRLGINTPMNSLKYLNTRYTYTSDTSISNPNKSSYFEIPVAKQVYVHPDPTNAQAADTTQWNSFDQLLKNLTSKLWNTAGKPAAKLNYPTVAWTYYGSSGDPLYSDYLVVARHSYSVLGLLKEDGKNFIVLRNPWGPVPNLGVPDNAEIRDNLATGPYQPPSSTNYALNSIPLYENVVNSDGTTTKVYGKSGIFGLEYKIFEKYFQGFGWVVPITCTTTTTGIPS